MYDLKPLEEEWEKYHRKKRVPFYIGILIGVFLIIMIVLSLYYDVFSKKSVQKNIVKVESTNSVVVNNDNKVMDNTLKDEVKNTIVAVETKDDKPIEMIVDNIPILEEESNKEVVKEKIINKPRKKIHLNIIESSSLDAYKDVEERFFKSRDVDDSLFLAKSYYRKGKYKKSEYWALQTNKINSTIDDSWVIFVQSKVKLGKKNEAISILRNYIKRTGSERAKNILLKIKADR